MNRNSSRFLSIGCTLLLAACGGSSSNSGLNAGTPAFATVVTDASTCTFGVLSRTGPINNVLIEQGQSVINVISDSTNNPTGTEIDLSTVGVSAGAVMFVNTDEGIDLSTVPIETDTRLDSFPECPVMTGLPFALGDTGPAGGIVFQISDGGLSGLEASVDELIGFYGCIGTEIAGADGIEIGAGQQNTDDILASCDEPDILARQADQYSFGGFSDWFLPSRGETNAIADMLQGSFFFDFCCISSSEFDESLVWFRSVGSGDLRTVSKSHATSRGIGRARAVRSF